MFDINNITTGRARPIIDKILKQIQSAELGPGEMIGTETDLAQRYGISRMTVRRAFDELVNQHMIERRAGKGVFVHPRLAIRQVFELVVPNLDNPWVQIVRGAQEFGQSQGVKIQVYNTQGALDSDLDTLRSLPKTAPAGAIIGPLPSSRFGQTLADLEKAQYPFVLVGWQQPHLQAPSVTSDDHAGGYAVGKQLVALGHRRIGFIGNLTAASVSERLQGMRDAMNDAGVAFDRSMAADLKTETVWTDFSESVDRCTRALMERQNPPTALHYEWDGLAADGCRVLKSMGLRIPEDVSVVGYHDDPLCQWLEPPLTTVRAFLDRHGKVAVEMLMQRIKGKEGIQSHVLPIEWVERDSVTKRKRA